jgi:hypothetical protein
MTNLDRVVSSWPFIQEAILALVDASHPSQNGWVSKPESTVHALAVG